jgi:hypothetical protein
VRDRLSQKKTDPRVVAGGETDEVQDKVNGIVDDAGGGHVRASREGCGGELPKMEIKFDEMELPSRRIKHDWPIFSRQ